MNLLVIFAYIKIFTGINASRMVGGEGKEGMKGRREGGEEGEREGARKEADFHPIFITSTIKMWIRKQAAPIV